MRVTIELGGDGKWQCWTSNSGDSGSAFDDPHTALDVALGNEVRRHHRQAEEARQQAVAEERKAADTARWLRMKVLGNNPVE